MSVNRVTLVGYVGQEPIVRWLDTGMCVASVRLGTTERGYTLANGTQVPERTEWHNVIFWNKQAELVEAHVKKGDKLFVEGKIQSRSYDDKKGTNHYVVEIMAQTVEFLSGKTNDSDNL
ncbi:MAG: single-stranded DNA-binding protein [Prevotellaceae bacterium]|nr:single-stranded DNA-binding protein [Candidatus Colivivens equi]